MNIIIAEDEVLAAERLEEMICKSEPGATITHRFDTVEEVVSFFKSGKSTDLLMLDIQLADGKSFEIFDRVMPDVPIIFTTAYNQYALHAFRYHSIDYLLKPVQPVDLRNALDKYKKIASRQTITNETLTSLKQLLAKAEEKYKERFIIKAGNKLHFKMASDVAFFSADGKTVYLVTRKENRKYIVDYTLEELENSLDPKNFFRISRKHIVCIDCIAEVRGLISGKLDLKLNQLCDQDLQVSRERAADFKGWLNR